MSPVENHTQIRSLLIMPSRDPSSSESLTSAQQAASFVNICLQHVLHPKSKPEEETSTHSQPSEIISAETADRLPSRRKSLYIRGPYRCSRSREPLFKYKHINQLLMAQMQQDLFACQEKIPEDEIPSLIRSRYTLELPPTFLVKQVVAVVRTSGQCRCVCWRKVEKAFHGIFVERLGRQEENAEAQRNVSLFEAQSAIEWIRNQFELPPSEFRKSPTVYVSTEHLTMLSAKALIAMGLKILPKIDQLPFNPIDNTSFVTGLDFDEVYENPSLLKANSAMAYLVRGKYERPTIQSASRKKTIANTENLG